MSNLAQRIKILCALLATLCLRTVAWSQESLSFPQDYRRELSKILERPLVDFAAEAPARDSASRVSIGLVIGNLQVDSADQLPWGLALGQLLRWKIPYAPQALLRVPHPEPEKFKVDLHSKETGNRSLTSLDSLAPAFERERLENALVGEAQIGQTTYALRLNLFSLPDRALRKSFTSTGKLEELPATLGRMSVDILDALQIRLGDSERDYLQKPTPRTFAELKRFVELLATSKESGPTDIFTRAEQYWTEGTELSAFIPFLCEAIYNNREPLKGKAGDLLRSILERLPKHPAVECIVLRYRPFVQSDQPWPRLYDAYRSLGEHNRVDLIPLIRAAEVALEGGGDFTLAITMGLHAVEYFPWNYRSWWALSGILKGAAQKMGKGGSLSTGSSSYRQAAELQRLSDSALARALEFFPDSPTLLRERLNRMWFSDGPSPEFWSVFDTVVDAGETDPTFYRNIVNTLASAGLRDFDSAMRALNGSLRNCPDSSFNRMLFQNGWTALDALDREAKVDPIKLCESAESLNRAYLRLAENQGPLDIPLGLESCLQCGADAHALKAARNRLQSAKDSNNDLSKGFVQLAEVALLLGDGDLAEACLNAFKISLGDPTPNLEDYIGSLRAMIPSARGGYEESRKHLERRISEAEDNIYSCLRYLELSLKAPVDEQTRGECIKFLIEYAPEEIEYKDADSSFGNPEDSGGAALYVQDVLRWISRGLLASASGDHGEAEKAFRRAERGERYLGFSMGQVITPSLMYPIWRERRALAGKVEPR